MAPHDFDADLDFSYVSPHEPVPAWDAAERSHVRLRDVVDGDAALPTNVVTLPIALPPQPSESLYQLAQDLILLRDLIQEGLVRGIADGITVVVDDARDRRERRRRVDLLWSSMRGTTGTWRLGGVQGTRAQLAVVGKTLTGVVTAVLSVRENGTLVLNGGDAA